MSPLSELCADMNRSRPPTRPAGGIRLAIAALRPELRPACRHPGVPLGLGVELVALAQIVAVRVARLCAVRMLKPVELPHGCCLLRPSLSLLASALHLAQRLHNLITFERGNDCLAHFNVQRLRDEVFDALLRSGWRVVRDRAVAT